MQLNLKSKLIFSLILIGLIFHSCKTQKSIAMDGFKNDFLFIEGLECVETISPNAIDSRVGTIECATITFTYDYGLYSNPGPITPKEEFRRSFDTYHHIKFFENRMIDPKVYKIFLDSVEVVDVKRKKDTDKLIFDCEPCNATAEITFKGDTYFFPFTMSEKQLDQEGYRCTFEEKGDLIYKYYQEDRAFPGLYIAPKKNRFKKKKTLSLVVTKTTMFGKDVDKVLKGVRLIQ